MKGHTYSRSRKPNFDCSSMHILDVFLNQCGPSLKGVPLTKLARKILKTRPRGKVVSRMVKLGYLTN